MGNARDDDEDLIAPGTRTVGVRHPVQVALLAAIATFGLLIVGESLWWNNAPSTYPSFLVAAVPRGATTVLELRDACGDQIEVASLNADQALVRCGTWWPARSVWRVPRSYVAQALPG